MMSLKKQTGNNSGSFVVRVWRSIFRHRLPQTELDRMTTIVSNFFLHIVPAKVHPHTLRATFTLGLGVLSAFLFAFLTITGIILMFHYVPSVERAYFDILDMKYVISYGQLLRNLHRWAAHAMVAIVFLHMARVFFTGSYKSPREFNWVLGMSLLLMTLLLSFTGYLLPWDQLAYWAIVVGSNIAKYTPVFGEKIRFLLLGGNVVGQGALLRFYVLHVAFLPAVALVLIAVHLWRIRKDGGLSRPDERGPGGEPLPVDLPPDGEGQVLYGAVPSSSTMVNVQDPDVSVPSWPHLTWRLTLLCLAAFILLMIAGLWFDAPLLEIANPEHPENPAKAPWYFLGLQELVSYSALTGGVLVPGLILLGLILIPYIDRDRSGTGQWFSPAGAARVSLFSFLGGVLVSPLLTWIQIRYGVRVLFPDAPQLWTDLINPASVFVFLIIVASLFVMRTTRSTRMAAHVVFSAFLGGSLVYTIIGVFLRGPNWLMTWPM